MVKRDPDVNPLYQVFDFSPYIGYVESKKFFKLKICFKPSIANYKYVDNFYIINDLSQCYEVNLIGIGIGKLQTTKRFDCAYYKKILFVNYAACIIKHKKFNVIIG